MVLRHPACIIPVALLVVGLRPTTGRVFPRFALGGGSSSGRLGEGRGQYQQQDTTGSSSLRERTVLRLGEGGHSCLVPGGIHRKGAWGLTVASGLRGGATGGDDSAEESDDVVDDDDDDDVFDDDDGAMDEEDFGEANFIGRLQQDWRKTPIITKTWFRLSVGMAVYAMVFNGNQWPSFLLLDWQPTIFKLQLWRLVTPFLYLGPVGINFLLTVHFAWTYMSQLEKLHYREPHTFVMLLAFGMGSLLLLTLVTGADPNSSITLGHSLSCFLVMVWSRKFAGTRVNVLDMFELSTELLPYFFVLQSLMMEGEIPWVDVIGLFIGYGWETLSMKGLLKAPKPLVNLFRNNAFLKAEYVRAGKEYGQDMPHDDDDDDDDAAQVPSTTGAADGAEEEHSEGDKKETHVAGAKSGGMASSGAARRGAAKAERGFGGDGKGEESVPSVEEEEEKASEEATARESEEETEEEEYGSAEEETGEDGEEESEGDDAEGSEEELVSEESDELEDDLDEEIESMLDEFESDLDAEDLSGSFDESEEDSFDG